MSHVRIRRNPIRLLEGPGPLPEAFRQISGFDKLPPEELRRYGWYPYQAVAAPSVDERSQQVVTRLAIGDDGVVRPEHEVVALSDSERHHRLAETRRGRLADLAAIRWRHETAGIVFDGVPLQTDRESRAALAESARDGEGERWKAANGRWYALSAERLQDADRAVRAHKRACFAREAALAEAIRDAASLEVLDLIDLEAGWPSR